MADREDQSARDLFEPLTPREQEILGLMAQGLSGPEIALALSIALSSVRTHQQNLYGKLGVNSRRGALTRAQALGLAGPPHLSTRPSLQHNLPLELTRFFGREPEISRINELLGEYRLVTVTGPGGVGKSRLALRLAEARLGDFAHGIWLVELAALSDPALVAQQAALTLGLRGGLGGSIQEALTDFLRDRQLLLLLDNCEHLAEACARLADGLLRGCPRLTVLATSREPLGCAGEAVFTAPSLPFPESDAAFSVERLQVFPSVRLFVDRARLAKPDYQPAPQEAAALGRICRRLDGVPLAIEMAAAWINTLSTRQLAEHLDDALGGLSSRLRSAPPRQQTLRATLDWSYDLLSADERRLLQRLSVFAGGCTLEAAGAVCSDESMQAGRLVEVLAALVAKSMVQADQRSSDETRYRLLEMVRQYGREKLEAAGESELIQRRHRDYFLTFFEVSLPERETRTLSTWPEAMLPPEMDNLRLALEWSFGHPAEVEAGPRLFWATGWRWPNFDEYVAWSTRTVAFCDSHPGVPVWLHSRILSQSAYAIGRDDPPSAVGAAQRAVEMSRQMGPEGKQTLMRNLYRLGDFLLLNLREVEQALAPIAESEALFFELEPEKLLTPAQLGTLMAEWELLKAETARQQGRFEEAKTHAAESIRLNDLHYGHWVTFQPRVSLGESCLALGELAEARAHFLEAAQLHQTAPMAVSRSERAYAIRSLGIVALREGNLGRALEYFAESLNRAAQNSDRNIVASCLGLMAMVAASQGQVVRAAKLSGASVGLWARQMRQPWEDPALEAVLPGWRDRPDHAAITQAYAAGHAMAASQAAGFALGDEGAPVEAFDLLE